MFSETTQEKIGGNHKMIYEEIKEMKREIEEFIEAYEGTAIGYSIKNKYENSWDNVNTLEDILEEIRG